MGDKVTIERVENGFILTSHYESFCPRMTRGETEIAATIEEALGIAYRDLLHYARATLVVEHVERDHSS